MARIHLTKTDFSPWTYDDSAKDKLPNVVNKLAEHDTAIDALEAGGSGVSGSGTANTVAKFTAPSVLGNSLIADDGTTVSTSKAVVVNTGAAGVAGGQGSLKVVGDGTNNRCISWTDKTNAGGLAGIRWSDTTHFQVRDLTNAFDWIQFTIGTQTVEMLGTLSHGQLVATEISPAGITGAVNDWAPTGLSTAATILVTSSAAAILLNGLTGGVAGRRITIVNNDAAQDLTIRYENTGSAAANRFVNPFGADISLAGGGRGSVTCEYYNSRWNVVAFSSFNQPGFNMNGPLGMNSNTITNVNNLTQIAGGRYDMAVLAGANQPAQQGGTIVSQYGYSIAGRNMPTALPGDNVNTIAPYQFQPFTARKRVGLWVPQAGSVGTTLLDESGNTLTTAGTPTTRSAATTNLFTSGNRIGYVSAAGAGSSCGIESSNTNVLWRGNAAGLGGFFMCCRFGISDPAFLANSSLFCGVMIRSNSTTATPSTLTELFGVGMDSGDTVLQQYGADSSARARTSLGANFPVVSSNVDVYELCIWCAPNSTTMNYQVNRLNTGHTTGTVTVSTATLMPLNNLFLVPCLWRNNGATATAVAVDLFQMYYETEL